MRQCALQEFRRSHLLRGKLDTDNVTVADGVRFIVALRVTDAYCVDDPGYDAGGDGQRDKFEVKLKVAARHPDGIADSDQLKVAHAQQLQDTLEHEVAHQDVVAQQDGGQVSQPLSRAVSVTQNQASVTRHSSNY